MSVNKVLLIGRLTKDPELKQTPSGTSVVNFSMATNETWYDKASGEKQDRTEFHNVVVWGKAADFVSNYVNKGRQVYIEGKLQTRSWEDKEGNKRYTTEVKADSVQALGSKTNTQDSPQQKAFNVSEPSIDADSIPF